VFSGNDGDVWLSNGNDGEEAVTLRSRAKKKASVKVAVAMSGRRQQGDQCRDWGSSSKNEREEIGV